MRIKTIFTTYYAVWAHKKKAAASRIVIRSSDSFRSSIISGLMIIRLTVK